MIKLENLSRTKLHDRAHFQFNTEIRHLVLEYTNAKLGTGEASVLEVDEKIIVNKK